MNNWFASIASPSCGAGGDQPIDRLGGADIGVLRRRGEGVAGTARATQIDSRLAAQHDWGSRHAAVTGLDAAERTVERIPVDRINEGTAGEGVVGSPGVIGETGTGV